MVYHVRTTKLAELLPLLNFFTLIEFKGPTDTLRWGDFSRLLGCAFLWYSRMSEPVGYDRISLMIVAPSVNGPLRDELRLLGCDIRVQDEGIFRITGPLFTTWVVETDVMAELSRPILSLVSRAFVSEHESIMKRLAAGGEGALAFYHYMVQNMKQFHSEEEDAMQQAVIDNLEQFEKELFTKMLKETPVEQRLQGLTPEELLQALPPEKLARLRELLQQRKEE